MGSTVLLLSELSLLGWWLLSWWVLLLLLLVLLFRVAEMVDDLSLWDQGVRDGDVLSLVISGPSDTNIRPVKVMKDVRRWQPDLFLA